MNKSIAKRIRFETRTGHGGVIERLQGTAILPRRRPRQEAAEELLDQFYWHYMRPARAQLSATRRGREVEFSAVRLTEQ